MWYFAWLLGTLFACSIAVIAGLAYEHACLLYTSPSPRD